jgi:DNA-binding response OmpR family regulator
MRKLPEIDTEDPTIAVSSASTIGESVRPTVPAEIDKVSSSNSDKTILFADDDRQLQKLLAALLHRYGYTVIVARDGNEALQKAREFDGTIDLLLSDVDMPGMTGIEVATQLNHERPDTKILLISGLNTGIPVLNSGWSFLPKPFLPEMLKNRIQDALSEQPAIKAHWPDALSSNGSECSPRSSSTTA